MNMRGGHGTRWLACTKAADGLLHPEGNAQSQIWLRVTEMPREIGPDGGISYVATPC